MDLNGVAPQAMTFFRAMFACMKARRLGDTLYYWDRMQRAGIQPDVRLFPVNPSQFLGKLAGPSCSAPASSPSSG